jgi:hypothetical protein
MWRNEHPDSRNENRSNIKNFSPRYNQFLRSQKQRDDFENRERKTRKNLSYTREPS